MDVRLINDCEPALVDALSRLAEEAFPGQPFSIAEEVARPWTRLWVTFGAGAPSAFLVGWHVADELHILNVATAVSARRQGLGTALLGELPQRVAQERTAPIELVPLHGATGHVAVGQVPRPGGYGRISDQARLLIDARATRRARSTPNATALRPL